MVNTRKRSIDGCDVKNYNNEDCTNHGITIEINISKDLYERMYRTQQEVKNKRIVDIDNSDHEVDNNCNSDNEYDNKYKLIPFENYQTHDQNDGDIEMDNSRSENDKCFIDINHPLLARMIQFDDLGDLKYKCCRDIKAIVKLNNNIIGSIEFILINRNIFNVELINMFQVCNNTAYDLDSIHNVFFKSNGNLDGLLKRRCKYNDLKMLNIGSIMSIQNIQLDEQYLKTSLDTHSKIAITTSIIKTLIHSQCYASKYIMLTLVLYKPHGIFIDKKTKEQIERDPIYEEIFEAAGFSKVTPDKAPFLYYPLY